MPAQEPSALLMRKRKMLLVLPILVCPFLILGFIALDGGGPGKTPASTGTQPEGLNTEIPDARFKDEKELNKLKYYQLAARDSAKHDELLKKDPYFNMATLAVPDSSNAGGLAPDTNEVKVLRKLAALDRELNRKNVIERDMPSYAERRTATYNDSNADIERLEKMLGQVQQSGQDPEMEQLNSVLDKVLAIQDPSRKKNVATFGDRSRGKIYPVSSETVQDNISLLVNETESTSAIDTIMAKRFHSSPPVNFDNHDGNAIEAVVHETRTVADGGIIKLRLLTDIFINGEIIRKGNFVYGKVSLSGERLNIDVNSIRSNQSLFPVSLAVYDLDGLDGVFIPGAITRDVSKESSTQLMQGIALNSLDPSIGAQAASAGIEAAKTLLTKKVKQVRVVVKKGYRVFLKSKQQ